jgi:hypothetical protein
VEIFRRCWSGPLDPIIPAEKKGFNSKMIMDACRPLMSGATSFQLWVRFDSKLLGEMSGNGERFLAKPLR